MTIHFIFLGRTRRPECRALFEDYAARIGRVADVRVSELREPLAPGPKALARGAVECKARGESTAGELPLGDAVARLVALVREGHPA